MEAATLTLPTRGGGPVASPELVRDEIGEVTGTASRLWQVPTLELEPDLALALLRGLDVRRPRTGHSVAHLIELAGFAADLVGRGRCCLGGRPIRPGGLAAGPHRPGRGLGPLLASSCRPVDSREPGDGFAVWADALDTLVDAAARAVLGSDRLSVGRPGTPATRAWLAALTGRNGGSRRRPAVQPDRDGRRLAARRRRRPGTGVLPAGGTGGRRRGLAGPVRAAGRDEPSLVVDAEAVWRARGNLPALARQLDAPQETFLAELGKASRLYPELDAALRTARPLGLSLDTRGRTDFSAAAPALATAGFGVQLPGWWTRPSSRLGLQDHGQHATPAGAGGGRREPVIGFASIAAFRYDLAVGGEVLTGDELDGSRELKAPDGAAARPVDRAGRPAAGGRPEAGRPDRTGKSR